MRLARLALVCSVVAMRLCGVDADDSKSGNGNVVSLTKYNFDDNVKQGAWFVKFYAPWCSHCKRLQPVWQKLADKAASQNWPVKVSEVDCTSHKDICEKFSIRGYPTLILISNNGRSKKKFSTDPSYTKLENFVMKELGLATSSSGAGSSDGVSVESKDDASGGPTHIQPSLVQTVAALLSNNPTPNKIANVYIVGGMVLVGVVSGLMMLHQAALAEEALKEKEG